MSRVLITGGLGFVGSNLAMSFLKKGHKLLLFDNLSDPSGGAAKNRLYLLQQCKRDFDKGNLKLIRGDVRDLELLRKAVKDVDVIIHTASQVAMVPSIENPKLDFEVNAIGSFNVLEAARLSNMDPILGYTSTNKVYGTLEDVPLVEKKLRWDYLAGSKYYGGISEDHPLG